MKFTLHATRRTPHGASRLGKQRVPGWCPSFANMDGVSRKPHGRLPRGHRTRCPYSSSGTYRHNVTNDMEKRPVPWGHPRLIIASLSTSDGAKPTTPTGNQRTPTKPTLDSRMSNARHTTRSFNASLDTTPACFLSDAAAGTFKTQRAQCTFGRIATTGSRLHLRGYHRHRRVRTP